MAILDLGIKDAQRFCGLLGDRTEQNKLSFIQSSQTVLKARQA